LAYYSKEKLNNMGFKYLGHNVKISDKASIYDFGQIEIGDNSRIDDFCVVSGKIAIGRNVHITANCLLAGGSEGIVFEDFTTLAYACQVFTQSDDYSGNTMTNSTIPAEYKNEYKAGVIIEKFSIIGAGSIIFPGVRLAEGTSLGAMTLVLTSTKPWGLYIGQPAKRVKERSKSMLEKFNQYISDANSDTF
jgi:acetyltransferase-like isoleucine patch superfamily enzyme